MKAPVQRESRARIRRPAGSVGSQWSPAQLAPRLRTPRLRILAALLVCAPGDGHASVAQSDRGSFVSEQKIQITASLITDRIRVDGRFDEVSWSSADSLTGFRQREPDNGAPATESTVIKILRDDEALYIGVRAFDTDSKGLRSTQLRRDADLGVDDNVTLLIDSFHDRRSAFVFQTNPNGARWDAQLSGSEELNENWNGVWDVAGSRDSAGWSVEFRIPFQTLRFPSGGSTTFGFNVQRLIRRRNELVLWRSYGRAEGLYQLANEGELCGVGGLSRGRDVEFRPYMLGRVIQSEHDIDGARTAPSSIGGKLGLDVKAALSPTLTLDLTANTDFAQVEADRQVINLTRFPLFFPEKREFFIESSGLFGFGAAGRAQLFYSRRIGLSEEGEPVSIWGGARVSGKAGPWSLGLLDVQTGGGEKANDAVVRVRHDLFERSYVGAIATIRSGETVEGTETALGLDFDLPMVYKGRNFEPFGWIAATNRNPANRSALAWRVAADYPNDLFDNFASLYRIDSGFDPGLGFVRLSGIWETTGHIDYMPRPGILRVRQLDLKFPIPSWDIVARRNGSLFQDKDWLNAEFEWRFLGGVFQTGDQFEVNLQRLVDAPADTFEIFEDVRLAPGQYWWTRGELQCETSSGRPLALGSGVNWGDFYTGRSRDWWIEGTWRGGGHLIAGADLSQSIVRLPEGHFTTTETSCRLEYAFDTRKDILAFVQFNNEDQRIDFNLRFHWIPVIGDDVFVVWNSGYPTDQDARYRFPHFGALTHALNGALVFKIVHRIAA